MRPLLPLLLLLLAFSLSLSGCKKKGDADSDTTLEADAESGDDRVEKSGKKGKGKKKSKKKGKKSKKKGKKSKKKGRKKGAEEKVVKQDSGGEDREAAETTLRKVREAKGDDMALPTAAMADKEAGSPPKRAAPRQPPAAVTPPPVKVAVARLLTVIDVNRLLQEKGWIAYGPVQGIPPSEYFNSLIYRKPGTNRFVTILVWEFSQYAQALEKWNEMAATYPNTQELKEMFTKFVFFSYRNQVSTLTALHEKESTVISVSCHSEVCDDTALYEMAKTAFGRIQ